MKHKIISELPNGDNLTPNTIYYVKVSDNTDENVKHKEYVTDQNGIVSENISETSSLEEVVNKNSVTTKPIDFTFEEEDGVKRGNGFISLGYNPKTDDLFYGPNKIDNGVTYKTYNTWFGVRSGLSAENAERNTTLGYNSLRNLRNGNDNVVIGGSSGANLKNGNKNTFIGFNAGGGVYHGFNNTFVGHSIQINNNEVLNFINKNSVVAKMPIFDGYDVSTLKNSYGFNEESGNIVSSNNTFIGSNFYQLKRSVDSIVIGNSPFKGGLIETFFNNIYVGKNLRGGYEINNSIIIGNNLNYNTNDDNILAIHNSKTAETDVTNALIYGNFSSKLLKINGKLQINQENNNVDGDLLYSKKLVAKPDGTIGFVDDDKYINLTLPENNNININGPSPRLITTSFDSYEYNERLSDIFKNETFNVLRYNDFQWNKFGNKKVDDVSFFKDKNNYIAFGLNSLYNPLQELDSTSKVLSNIISKQKFPLNKEWVIRFQGDLIMSESNSLKLFFGLNSNIEENYFNFFEKGVEILFIYNFLLNSSSTLGKILNGDGTSSFKSNIILTNIGGRLMLYYCNDKGNQLLTYHDIDTSLEQFYRLNIGVGSTTFTAKNYIDGKITYWISDTISKTHQEQMEEDIAFVETNSVLRKTINKNEWEVANIDNVTDRIIISESGVLTTKRENIGINGNYSSANSKVRLPRDKDWRVEINGNPFSHYNWYRIMFGFTDDENNNIVKTPTIGGFVSNAYGFYGFNVRYENEVINTTPFNIVWYKRGDNLYAKMTHVDTGLVKYGRVSLKSIKKDLWFVVNFGTSSSGANNFIKITSVNYSIIE